MELIKDYDLEIHYHPGKANLVADALSRKEHVHSAIVVQLPDELAKDFERLNLGIVTHTEGVTIELEPTLEQEIRKYQVGDAKIQEIKDLITEGRVPEFTEDEQGTIWFKDQICVPEIDTAAIILAYISSGDSESEPPEPPGRPSASLSTQAKVAF